MVIVVVVINVFVKFGRRCCLTVNFAVSVFFFDGDGEGDARIESLHTWTSKG